MERAAWSQVARWLSECEFRDRVGIQPPSRAADGKARTARRDLPCPPSGSRGLGTSVRGLYLLAVRRWLVLVLLAICVVTAAIAVPLLTGRSGPPFQTCPNSDLLGSAMFASSQADYNRLVTKYGGNGIRTSHGGIHIYDCRPAR